MHLLRVEEGGALYDSDEAVDLGQPPGDIVILTSADTEVSLLSAAVAGWQAEGDVPEVRIANYLSLSHPFSVDQYIASTIAGARLVIVRLLGGSAYWTYGVQQLRAQAEAGGVPVAFLPGDARPDPELDYLSTFDTGTCRSLAAYLDAGGRTTRSASFTLRATSSTGPRPRRRRVRCCGRNLLARNGYARPAVDCRRLGGRRAGGGHCLLPGLAAGRRSRAGRCDDRSLPRGRIEPAAVVQRQPEGW